MNWQRYSHTAMAPGKSTKTIVVSIFMRINTECFIAKIARPWKERTKEIHRKRASIKRLSQLQRLCSNERWGTYSGIFCRTWLCRYKSVLRDQWGCNEQSFLGRRIKALETCTKMRKFFENTCGVWHLPSTHRSN